MSNNNNNRQPLEKEKSLHLRDIFGSTYSFEDDPVDLITASLHSGNVSATPSTASATATTTTTTPNSASSPKQAPQHVNRKLSRSASARLPRLAAESPSSSPITTSKNRPTPGALKRTASLKSLRQRKQNRQAQQQAIIRDKSEEKYKPSHDNDAARTKDHSSSTSTGLERMSSFAKRSSTKPLSAGNHHNNNNNNNNNNNSNNSSENATEDVNPKEIQLGMSTLRQHHQAQQQSSDTTTPDLEAAAAQIFHQSFFQDEYDDHHDVDKQQHASVGSSGPMILAHAITTNNLAGGSNNNTNNNNNDTSDDNHDTTTNNDRDKLLATVAVPCRVVVDEHETRRRRWCIACGVGLGLLTLFMAFNLIMMAIWNPKDVIPTDVSFGEEQASSSNGEFTTPTPTPAVVPTTTLTMDDLGPLPPSTMDAIQTQDINVPQFMAFAWLQADARWPTYSIQRRRQRFALAVLYFATNPPLMHQWTRAGHWLSYKVSECHWLSYTMPEEQQDADPEEAALNLCRVPPPKYSNDTATTTNLHGNATTQPPERNDGNNNDTSDNNSTFIMIRHLPLSNNNLQGALPTEELEALLPHVVSIQLQNNPGLTGRLPSSWCPKRSRADADLGKQQQNNATIVHVQCDCAATANNNDADTNGQEVKSGGGLCGCHCPC